MSLDSSTTHSAMMTHNPVVQNAMVAHKTGFNASSSSKGGYNNTGNHAGSRNSPSNIGKENELRRDKAVKKLLKCDYCGINGHLREGCFKLIGYPDWFKELKEQRSFQPGRISAHLVETDLETKSDKKETGELMGMMNNIKRMEQELSRMLKGKGIDREHINFAHFSDFAGDPIPETIPVTKRHPEWFRPLEASLEKKDTVEDTDGSSTYTAAAAIYHFGDTRIEFPIIEEVAATLTEEESLKMLTTAMASILIREKALKQEIASLQIEKGLLEQEKLSSEESRKEEQALRLAREQELAKVQAMYKEIEAKVTEYRETHVPRSDLQAWMITFWARMVPTGGLASILLSISNDAKALGGHGVAVAALERMESGRTINAGWLQQFIRPHPKKTLHEPIKNGLQQLSDGQLPLFGPLYSAVAQMGSSSEIASFEGDALKMLPDDA
ncbi:OLC1v1015952C1 [Oldenlandia corymbosa var. corymbosa]|uniref:OLC1v1015952C1 n=1 Tax=Oldenlandia corymbosa var. corymbosa TaxID=529605 RepID=A0AAV1E4E5_OLDCO|nr:OLC1v1015952C1 [Oldenlandia corymbosa var. corymbosa]